MQRNITLQYADGNYLFLLRLAAKPPSNPAILQGYIWIWYEYVSSLPDLRGRRFVSPKAYGMLLLAFGRVVLHD